MFIQNLFTQALDLIFPAQCVHCQRVGALICGYCEKEIKTQKHPQPPLNEYIGSIGPHEGVLRAAIHALKYERETRLGRWLGQRLAQTIKSGGVNFDLIIPVPLHSTRLAERGYNQAKQIADGIVEILGVPMLEDALIRTRYTSSQVDLSAEERQQNVADAFAVAEAYREDLPNYHILLVDDVFTTGATLGACIITLRNIGVENIGVATASYANSSSF